MYLLDIVYYVRYIIDVGRKGTKMDEEWMLESNIAPWLDAEMMADDMDDDCYGAEPSTMQCTQCGDWVWEDDWIADEEICNDCATCNEVAANRE
jgi:acetyl-CoA carboxylase beta subunit